MNKYIVTKEYCLNLSKEKIKNLFTQIQKSLNDEEFNEEFLQEVVGNFSSAGVVSFVSMVGGGIALFVNPIAGTFILITSIAYGSWLKVSCGRHYRQRLKRIKQSKIVANSENISNQITLKNVTSKILKKMSSSSSIEIVKINSSKYGIIRLFSKEQNTSKKIFPIHTIKNC